jgi:hypothetical protein
MTHYSEDESMCRVDFFKPSGKWYSTEAIRFIPRQKLIHDCFRESLEVLNGRYSGMTAVCLNPNHENTHPISVVINF